MNSLRLNLTIKPDKVFSGLKISNYFLIKHPYQYPAELPYMTECFFSTERFRVQSRIK